MSKSKAADDFHQLAGWLPKQRQACRAMRSHRYVLYGGGRGGGKSRWLRWALLWRLLLYAKRGYRNVRVGLFTDTFENLRDRQLGKVASEFPPWLGSLKASQESGLGFHLNPEYGGGVLCFRNLDDPAKYASAEFADIGIDEIQQTDYDTFTRLRGSLRWPGIEDGCFLATAMPGGLGHAWVKSLWIDRVMPEGMEDAASEVAFVPALLGDNPHNAAAYQRELERLPEKLRRAWLEGDWDVLEGQVFTEFRRDLHVIKGGFIPPKDWLWTAGLDWGMRDPGWYGLFAIGPEERMVLWWEWAFNNVRAKDAGKKLGMAMIALQRATAIPRPDQILHDDQMLQMHGHEGPDLAEQFTNGLREAMGANAPPMIPAPKGSGSRLAKKMLLHQALSWEADKDGKIQHWGMPKFRVHERCEYWLRTIPALVYFNPSTAPQNKQRLEDVDTRGEDHAYDGTGNVLLFRVPKWERPAPPPPPDVHPGYVGRRRKRHGSEEDDQREAIEEALRNATGTDGSPTRLGRGMYGLNRFRIDLENE